MWLKKIWRPRCWSPICFITRTITDRIGQHEFLLPIIITVTISKKKCILLWWKSIWIPNVQNQGKYHWRRHCLNVTNSSILENPQFGRVSGYCSGYCDNFCDWWVQLNALVRLQGSDYRQLSDYNPAQWLVKNKVVNAPVEFEEIVMVMIKTTEVGKTIDKSIIVNNPFMIDIDCIGQSFTFWLHRVSTDSRFNRLTLGLKPCPYC